MANIYQLIKALNSTIHLVIDGWTAPIVASFLGIVVVWFSDGIIILLSLNLYSQPEVWKNKILLLINSRLTQKHDGVYLAEATANCLK